MRSPEAIARWYWPTHMPTPRSGITSSTQVELTAKKPPRVSWPLITWQPADQEHGGDREARARPGRAGT